MTAGTRFSWVRVAWPVGVVALLLCLAAANVARRAWTEVEDGVLWAGRPEGVVAVEVAPGSPAAQAGVRAGDILELVDSRPVDRPRDVLSLLHRGRRGEAVSYTLVRPSAQVALTLHLEPIPTGDLTIYYILAAVGIFTLLVGASVRLRRPGDQATLHFFWLSVAFFGVMAFSYSGRLDTLDWVFFWGDVVALLAVPPMFLHFALVFPDRPDAWVHSDTGRTLLPLIYLPSLLLGGARVAVIARGAAASTLISRVLETVDRLELLVLAVYLIAGLALMVRALGRVRSVTARRQLRWITWGTLLGGLPFALGYGLPWAFGFDPLPGMEYTAVLLGLVPLAFASAIVRYRLMDVEVIIKRGLVYAAAVAAIAAIYAVLLRVAGGVLLDSPDQHNTVIAMLATLVVVLLANPVKNAIQTALDRVYYRDRYDYRRALVAFARDLNSDLDLLRLSERLVTRVRETLLVDRMALMLAPTGVRDGRRLQHDRVGRLRGDEPAGAADPRVGPRRSADRPAPDRARRPDHAPAGLREGDRGLARRGHLLLRALRVEGGHDRRDGAGPQAARRAAQQRGHGAAGGGGRPGGHRARERPALPPAAREGRRSSSACASSARTSWSRSTTGWSCVDVAERDRAVEPRARGVCSGVRRAEAVGRRLDELFDATFVEALRRRAARAPDGTDALPACRWTVGPGDAPTPAAG